MATLLTAEWQHLPLGHTLFTHQIMKHILFFFAYFYLVALSAQTKLVFEDESFGCSYISKPKTNSVFGFVTKSEAEAVIKDILDISGLEPTFKIYAAGIDNAEARIIDEERVIIYNQNFMSEVKKKTGSKWAAISILAHEVAHHVQGHTIKAGGSQPTLELEADKWSGFVLYKLGAKEKEAQIAMGEYASTIGSSTHPARSDRLQAIAVGWANAKFNDSKPNKIPSDTEVLSNAPPKNKTKENNNKNHKKEEEEVIENTANTVVTFNYLGNLLYTINADVKIHLNGTWYTPPGNSFYIDDIPPGHHNYQISGNLNYVLYNIPYSIPVDNYGDIHIYPNSTVYIIVDYNMTYNTFSIRLSNCNY